MVKTTFWSPNGTPISAEQFLRQLFGDLPTFFTNEDELRQLWSNPNTRRELLMKLSDKGYSIAQLEDLRKLVRGEDSDLFDVLAYVAYNKDLIPRYNRAKKAKNHLDAYSLKEQEFLNFVLDQYIRDGVTELDVDKLPGLLTLKYQGVTDGIRKLGDVESIRGTFIGFQEFLYQRAVVY